MELIVMIRRAEEYRLYTLPFSLYPWRGLFKDIAYVLLRAKDKLYQDKWLGHH